jgi:hypothetical protein
MNFAIGVVLIAVFVTGVIAGVVLIFVVASFNREERAYSLKRSPPDQVARGTRLLTGTGRRADGARNRVEGDKALNDTWISTTSQIEDNYKLIGPPPPGQVGEDQDG